MRRAIRKIKSKLNHEDESMNSDQDESSDESNSISEPVDSQVEQDFKRRLEEIKSRKYTYVDINKAAFPEFNESLKFEKNLIFWKKCRLCCVHFSFYKEAPEEYKKAYKRKYQLLAEINQHVKTPRGWFNSETAKAVVELVEANIFMNPLRVPQREDQIVCTNKATKHSLKVLTILQNILNGDVFMNAPSRTIFSIEIIPRMVLFSPELDPVEFCFANNLISQACCRFNSLRRPFVKALGSLINEVLYKNISFLNILSFLVFYTSLLRGFRTPLNKEHTEFFRQSIIPLYGAPFLSSMEDPVGNITNLFLAKEPKLGPEVVSAMAKILPRVTPLNAIICIQAVHISLMYTSFALIKPLAEPIVLIAERFLTSENAKVCEETLNLIEDPQFNKLVAMDRNRFLPLTVRALERNKDHWNTTVAERSVKAAQLERLCCEGGWSRVLEQFEKREYEEKTELEKRLKVWDDIKRKAEA